MVQRSDLLDIDLEKQLHALAKEVGRLKKTAATRGSALYDRGSTLYDDAGDTLSDYYGGLSDFVASNLPGLRRRARAFETTATNHPAVAAAVGLVVVGLVASLFWRGARNPSRHHAASARDSGAPKPTSGRCRVLSFGRPSSSARRKAGTPLSDCILLARRSRRIGKHTASRLAGDISPDRCWSLVRPASALRNAVSISSIDSRSF